MDILKDQMRNIINVKHTKINTFLSFIYVQNTYKNSFLNFYVNKNITPLLISICICIYSVYSRKQGQRTEGGKGGTEGEKRDMKENTNISKSWKI